MGSGREIKLDFPRKRSDNNCMMNERYIQLIDELLDTPEGLDFYCWIRSRVNAHYEHNFDGELEGSSDVSCYMYELWNQRGVDKFDEGFGFWINGEICDIIGVPRVSATVQYHDMERA